jgi:hypothetical protein
MSEQQDIAFSVQGVPITAAQRDAGIAAMMGQFKASDVRRALRLAGVPDRTEAYSYLIERVADRLMQAERKAGRIRAINNKTWERVA